MADLGLFGELDIANAKDPNFIEPNTYEGFVTKAEMKSNEEKGTRNLVLTLTIDGGDFDNCTILHYQRVPIPDEPKEDDERAKGWLKNLLTSLGVPEERMNAVNPGDLQGIPITFSVIKNGTYINARNIQVREEDTGSAPHWN